MFILRAQVLSLIAILIKQYLYRVFPLKGKWELSQASCTLGKRSLVDFNSLITYFTLYYF